MKKINVQKIMSLLLAGTQLLMLTGCGKNSSDDLYMQYNQTQNAFSQYSGIELSTVTGHAQPEELSEVPDETEQPSDENVATDSAVLAGQLYTFADGGVGLLIEYDNRLDRELPESIQNGEYAQMAASGLTKFMTAYVILKYANLEDTVTYQTAWAADLEGAKKAGFQEGDVLTVEQLLYAMFVASGNDAANALAYYQSGNISDFAALMNQEAAALGAVNTHFVNPTGLDAEGQYTTLYDMYLIIAAAMSYDYMLDFIQVSAVNDSYISADGTEVEYQWVNPNEFVNKQFAVEGTTTLAGQSSLTGASGYCGMYYYMDENNTRYLGITMKANGYDNFYGNMREMVAK